MTLDQGMALTTTIASVLGGMAAIATAPVIEYRQRAA
jgi:hypothetical protein